MEAPPLVVTADARLREQLLRLAAAAGVLPQVVAADDTGPPRGWSSASAVVVGADQAAALARLGPPRRDGVMICAPLTGVPAVEAPDPVVDPVVDPALLHAGLALGAERVVCLPRDEAAVVAALADLAEPDGGGPVVAVVGGSGGAGASVLAGALATRAAAHGRTLLADLDPLGAGAGRLLGLPPATDALGWPDLERGSGRLGAGALRDAVPRTGAGVGVLGWPGRPGPVSLDTVREALDASARGHRAVVLDLPRHDLAGMAGLVARAAAVVVVCVATLPGASATARLLGHEALAGAAPLLLVRGEPREAARVGRALGVGPSAVMGDQPGLEEALALGLGPVRAGPRAPRGRAGSLARAADAVWRAVPGGAAW